MKLDFKHFIALTGLDIMTTWYAISHMGLSEGNPILSSIFHDVGLITGLVAIKLLGLVLIYALIKLTPNIKIKQFYNMTAQKIGVTTICLLMLIVVTNNIIQIMFA